VNTETDVLKSQQESNQINYKFKSSIKLRNQCFNKGNFYCKGIGIINSLKTNIKKTNPIIEEDHFGFLKINKRKK
jgi:hypothetical protein